MQKQTVSLKIAGDSGDGVQFAGEQFTLSCAMSGSDVQTYPDFPAEIRAPAGSLEGVSGYQLSLSDYPMYALADELDVLMAMNPAALKKSLSQLKKGGLLLLNIDAFSEKELSKAGYVTHELYARLRQSFEVLEIPLTSLTIKALAHYELSHSETKKCKNIYGLGILLWLFSLPLEPAQQAIAVKFKNKAPWLNANLAALNGGYQYAMNTELERGEFQLQAAPMDDGAYRQVNGNEAIALALASIAVKTKLPVFIAGYPITPASELLHQAHRLSAYGISTFQAEDEIAAACAALGASYGGRLAFTCTSGPGLDLKQEAIGLGVMAELPLVIIDVQRSGPSTGMPTKTEQSDLLTAIHGRHGESRVPVIAAKSPSDCFSTLIAATNMAIKTMSPVIMLSDAQMANGSEPWKIPDVDEIAIDKPHFNQDLAYKRDANGVPPWVWPGTPGFEYCASGLEKDISTGQVSFDASNHQRMTNLRASKLKSLIDGQEGFEYIKTPEAKVLLISWGGTYGSVRTLAQNSPVPMSVLHLKLVHPLPQTLALILKAYELSLCIELNDGQLCQLLRAHFLHDIKSISKVAGQAFKISELWEKIVPYLQQLGCYESKND